MLFNFDPKNLNEIITLSFGFGGDMLSSDVIETAVIMVTTHIGTDPNPSAILLLSPDLSLPTWVMQRVQGGLPGCFYLFHVQATLASGNILVRDAVLPIYPSVS
jgi:hypothetical protein